MFKIRIHPNGTTNGLRALLSSAELAIFCLMLDSVQAQVQQGASIWTNRYNGPGNSWDVAYAAATDQSGNVLVGGYSRRTASSGTEDYLVVKYSASGSPLWTNRYNGTADSGDYVRAVAFDPGGNAFVTGHSIGVGTSDDIVTIKYSPTGMPLWTNRYDGPGHDIDRAYSVVAHPNGKVYVAGYSAAANGYPDYLAIAYSSDGVPLWTNRYDGPSNDYDEGYAMAADASGNVFVTGWSFGADYEDMITIAYSASGVALWTNQFDGPGHGSDAGSAITTDPNGSVIVAVYSSGDGTGDDYATIKYSGAGVALWTNRYSGPGSGLDFPAAVAVDSRGNAFVTGYSVGMGSGNDYATIKYSSDGIPLWTNRYNGPGNSTDEARSLALDNLGNALVTGFSRSTASLGSEDYATIAYSNTGIPLWTNRYNGPANGDDRANRVVSAGGRAFVTGYSTGIGTSDDYATLSYVSGAALSPITIDLQKSGSLLILIWTNAAYSLQSAATPAGTYTNIPGSMSPFTNPISTAEKYFRLTGN